MRNALKVLAILALIAVSGVANQTLFANCQNEGPYEVRQCAKGTWFAPPAPDAGVVAATWWAVGFGNRLTSGTPTVISPEGSGFTGTTGAGVFIGVDAGISDNAGLDLVDATSITGIGAPAGSLCFSSRANWGAPGTDSCIDINRTDSAGGGTGLASDNYVNRYWDVYAPYPYGVLYYNHQLDPPMGVLLTEGNSKYFAAAFFTTAPKVEPREYNLDPGQYWMDQLTNGDAGPVGPNVVPWQLIPQPTVGATIADPGNPTTSTRNLQFTWASPRFIHDNSSRPCFLTDGITPCSSVRGGGVGVTDQGPLIHFEVELVALDLAGVCGTAWTMVVGSRVDHPATAVGVTGIPPNSCVRLKTSFGRIPAVAFNPCPGCTLATQFTTARNANRLASQTGGLGDQGYFVASTPVKVGDGSALLSQKATLKFASREKGALHVAFDTDTEVNVTGFDVVGIDGKGGRKVLGSVSCTQCTSGLSASYDELIPGAKLQGSKKVQIVVQPSGTQSNTLDLK